MNIPDKVVNRLTLYHFILDDLREDEKYISSTRIANLLNIDNSQVRKDLKYLDNSGKCRVGYEVKSLKRKIEERLGFEQTKDAFIVGAGNLGSALAKYNSFKDWKEAVDYLSTHGHRRLWEYLGGIDYRKPE